MAELTSRLAFLADLLANLASACLSEAGIEKRRQSSSLRNSCLRPNGQPEAGLSPLSPPLSMANAANTASIVLTASSDPPPLSGTDPVSTEPSTLASSSEFTAIFRPLLAPCLSRLIAVAEGPHLRQVLADWFIHFASELHCL
ncbi:unnamed protein product [Protopolystoma xenopodis]|uniref:Uncharacterized protein n=1 Tax=Protopolystoma xenopodis TaxID=117903 RepID=A0A3S5CJ97_9PLAT|nr:unnamed protein product [Protopolystoma xenopodis]